MQILIGCAKDMRASSPVTPPRLTEPRFAGEARRHALLLASLDTTQLQHMLAISARLAREVFLRYQHFFSEDNQPLAAVLAYHGVVFRNMGLETFTASDFDHAQRHLWITSFLYGLLRPLDGIKPYRLEGKAVLPGEERNLMDYWKPRLTDLLIESVRADDGILVNLASAEMQQLFHWQRVEAETRVIRPEFLVSRSGRVSMPSVYAKKCRGAMTAWMLRSRLTDPARMRDFSFEGFTYRGDDRSEDNPVFMAEL